jgi:U3 small nucleolar RNA-associated protein 20
MVQACMKMMTLLMGANDNADDAADKDQRIRLPLDTKSLRSLISLLQSAALDFDHHNSTFSLVKVLVAHRVLVPEMYDLMDKLVDISVTSRRPTVRQMTSQIVVRFLLEYPLASGKVAGYVQRIVQNLDYEYKDGRAAAVGLMAALTAKLPTAVLDEHTPVIFLPLVLRLVNDGDPEVREAAAEALRSLVRRVSGDCFHMLLEYQLHWLAKRDQGEAGAALACAAAQCIGACEPRFLCCSTATDFPRVCTSSGILADARPDLLKRGEFGMKILGHLTDMLVEVNASGAGPVEGSEGLEAPHERVGETLLSWEVAYHSLRSLERIYERLPALTEAFVRGPSGARLLPEVSDLLCYRHAWIRLASCRLLGRYLDRRSPASVAPEDTAFLGSAADVFSLMRRLCVQLDRPNVAPDLSLRAVKNLVFLVSLTSRHPEQYALVSGKEGDADSMDVDEQADPANKVGVGQLS